eukprot:scaffold59585_cov36-Phaeocystis_antarctica.AAC.3
MRSAACHSAVPPRRESLAPKCVLITVTGTAGCIGSARAKWVCSRSSQLAVEGRHQPAKLLLGPRTTLAVPGGRASGAPKAHQGYLSAAHLRARRGALPQQTRCWRRNHAKARRRYTCCIAGARISLQPVHDNRCGRKLQGVVGTVDVPPASAAPGGILRGDGAPFHATRCGGERRRHAYEGAVDLEAVRHDREREIARGGRG